MSETLAEDFREQLIQEECAMSRELLTDNIEELRLFLDTLEDFIAREEERQVTALQPHATGPDFWAYHYPYQWQQIIGSQLRQSFVVSLMSATEFHLGFLCRDAASIVRAQITHEDLKGALVVRSRKFLGVFAGFTAPAESSWELVGDLYTLRNKIVHEAALVDAGRKAKRLSAFMQRSPGISNPSAGLLEIKREFCTFALNAVASFFQELHEQQVLLCRKFATRGLTPGMVGCRRVR